MGDLASVRSGGGFFGLHISCQFRHFAVSQLEYLYGNEDRNFELPKELHGHHVF